MTSRAAAGRYARSLLDVSLKEGDPEGADTELTDFLDLLKKHPALEHALVNPAVPAAQKKALVSELTARAGYSPVVAKLLALLATRDRMAILPDLAAAYRDRLWAHRQVVVADVTTAVPLPPEQAHALEQKLSEVTGRRVTLTARIDPQIVGGVVARIGSVVYDGSITRQLEKMKEKLLNR